MIYNYCNIFLKSEPLLQQSAECQGNLFPYHMGEGEEERDIDSIYSPSLHIFYSEVSPSVQACKSGYLCAIHTLA